MNSLAALKSSATTFLKFFLAQAVYVGMVTVNWRAISAANIPKSLISEMAISAGSFFVVRQIAKGGSGIISGAGFVAGATTGMYLALRYFG